MFFLLRAIEKPQKIVAAGDCSVLWPRSEAALKRGFETLRFSLLLFFFVLQHLLFFFLTILSLFGTFNLFIYLLQSPYPGSNLLSSECKNQYAWLILPFLKGRA